MVSNPIAIPSVAGVSYSDSAGRQMEPLTCSIEDIPKKDEFVMKTSAIGIGSLLAPIFDWVVNHIATTFGEELMAPIAKKIKSLFPKPLTSKDTLIYETLYDSFPFDKAVDTIIKEWAETTPAEALKYSFEFLYRYNPKHTLALANQIPYIVEASDLKRIMEKYNLTPIQIYNIAREVHEELGTENNSRWNEILNAIIDAKYGSTGAPETANFSLTDTQKIFLRNMRIERIRLELDTLKDIFRELSNTIKSAPIKNSSVSIVKMGQFEINIGPEVLKQSMGRFALSEFLEALAYKIESRVPLEPEVENFIDGLIQKNPVIQTMIDARTNHADMTISGTNRAIRMVEEAQLGEHPWFLRILKEMSGHKEPIKIGIIIQDETGKETARYEFEYNMPGLSKGVRTAIYPEGELHPIKPLNFNEGHVFIVKGNSEIVEDTVMITDGRNRSYFISPSEMEKFKGLAREITANKPLKTSEVGRAFLRFFNRLQSVWVMVYGNKYEVEPGSPEANIRKIAELLKREQWSVRLEQSLDWTAKEFSSQTRMAIGSENEENGWAKEFLENAIEEQITSIRKTYIGRFRTELRQEFKKLTNQLEKALVGGDVPARNRMISEIRILIAKQIGNRRQADTLSLDLYDEVTAWREVDSVKPYLKNEPPEKLRNAILARGVDESILPTLERARKYVKDGSYDRAFLEYDRVVAENGIPVSDKMTAQAEKARLAVEKLQFQRAKRALDWIAWMKATSREVPAEALAIIEKLPPLNGDSRVVANPSKEVQSPPKEAISDLNIEGMEITKPNMSRFNGIKKFTYEIGGPAIFGAVTFLGAREFVTYVLGNPETQLEAVFQGYETIGTAVLIERGFQKFTERFIGTTAVPMGLKSFLGGLGSSVIVYKGIEGVAKGVGMSDGPAEITGLVGTGAAYGAWKPIIKTIFSPERAMDIISFTEKVMTRGGIAYLIVDGVPMLTEAVYNQFDDDVLVRAREEWYNAEKEERNNRGIFGDAEDVEWYYRITNSISNVVDVFVPSSLYKFTGPLFNDTAARWLLTCKWKLKNGHPCR